MKIVTYVNILLFLSLIFNTSLYSQRKIKKGVVKFVLNSAAENKSNQLDFMKGTTLDCYFSSEHQKMDMSMMEGMMRVQTILSLEKKEAILLMDMMGQKFQITGLNHDQAADYNNFMYLDNVEKIIYHKKNKKKILGYRCYLAEVINKDGSSVSYYITKKIYPPRIPKNKDTKLLKGYPLEIIIDVDKENKMIFTAKEVSKDLSLDDFKVKDGYTKMTMEEYELKMKELGKVK